MRLLNLLSSLFRPHCQILMGPFSSTLSRVPPPLTPLVPRDQGFQLPAWSRAWAHVLLADPFRSAAPRWHQPDARLPWVSPHRATPAHNQDEMRFQPRRLASQGGLEEAFQTNQGVHRGLQNQPYLSVRIPAKKWFRQLGGGGSIVPFGRRAETQQLSVANTWYSPWGQFRGRVLLLSCLASARGKTIRPHATAQWRNCPAA